MIESKSIKIFISVVVLVILQSCVFHYFEKYTRVQVVNQSDVSLVEVFLMVRPGEKIILAEGLEANENSKVIEIGERGEYPIEIWVSDSLRDTLDAVEMRGGSQRVVVDRIDGEWVVLD